MSLFSYLDALDGAYSHFIQRCGSLDFFSRFKKHVYHAPFPGMTLQAHRSLVSLLGLKGKAAVLESFEEKVREGIHFAQRIGGCYGASNFVCLLGLLQTSGDLEAGDRVSVFAYGSGCTSEFYEVTIGPEAKDRVRALGLDEHIDGREDLTIDQYEAVMRDREEKIDLPGFTNDLDEPAGSFERIYKDQGHLILLGVTDFKRKYGWS